MDQVVKLILSNNSKNSYGTDGTDFCIINIVKYF